VRVSFCYAVTVHSAWGVAAADSSHAVLAENASRALLYVMMTAVASPTPLSSTNATRAKRRRDTKNPLTLS
jgi:hypothetical protein